MLSYAVAELGVNHVIVMGHYGCGGVAASIASPPPNQIDAANGAVQNWIQPIREIFRTSTRTEIVELRTKLGNSTTIEEPDIKERAYLTCNPRDTRANQLLPPQPASVRSSRRTSRPASHASRPTPLSPTYVASPPLKLRAHTHLALRCARRRKRHESRRAPR